MWEWFKGKISIPVGSRILDVGYGNGLAMKLMWEDGFLPYGITCNKDEFAETPWVGFKDWVAYHDMHDIPHVFYGVDFHAVWCRHVLEHSPVPLFALRQIHKRLVKDGYLYVEVPDPDTSCDHVNNKNHYSVFGKRAWEALIRRSGFRIIDGVSISFETEAGDDLYRAWACQKEG
jgi:2-polyprenyl-3-methyl-5-hydroxy-6-metoxy-1,4-benzoquinol methylase